MKLLTLFTLSLLLTSSLASPPPPTPLKDLSISFSPKQVDGLKKQFQEKGWVKIPRCASPPLIKKLPTFIKQCQGDINALQHYEMDSNGEKVLTHTEYFAHSGEEGFRKVRSYEERYETPYTNSSPRSSARFARRSCRRTFLPFSARSPL